MQANPEKAQEIGQRGKKMAQRKFKLERYHADWQALIDQVFESGWLPKELSDLKKKLLDLYEIVYFSPNDLEKKCKTAFESVLETVLTDHNKKVKEKYGK